MMTPIGARAEGRVTQVTILLCVASLGACSASRTFSLTRPEPIPYADTVPGPEPAVRERSEGPRLARNALTRQVSRALSVRRAVGREHESINITHFDDVVSSAWFERRNAYQRMSPAEVARGPATGGPDTDGTLAVIAEKRGGITPGFTIRDARGDTFLVKFDPKGSLHLGSAAGVIANRLFYAAGYYTPEDYTIVFERGQVKVDPEALVTTPLGPRAMTEEDVDQVLARTDPLPDGRYLAIASKLLPGKLLGPFYFSGVRKDDPNDYYHHEFRRELRGLYVVSAWLNHVDMRFENTRDVYIDPPGYVRHYLIDFAASLGSGTIRPHNPREGAEYNFDIWPTLARLFTLGFYTAGWEGQDGHVVHPSIGFIPIETYDPGSWKANWPNPAFDRVTARDGYWGAKLVASFSDEQLRAAVAEGKLPAEATDTLVKILAYRRDKTVAHWYRQVTPIEGPEAIPTTDAPTVEIRFDDLGLRDRVWDAADTRYVWTFEDDHLGLRSGGTTPARPEVRQTVRLELSTMRDTAPARRNAKATLRVLADRPDASTREAIIYLRWEGRASGYRVVGLEH